MLKFNTKVITGTYLRGVISQTHDLMIVARFSNNDKISECSCTAENT